MLRKFSKWALLLLLVYILIGAIVPYVRHIPVSGEVELPEAARGERVRLLKSNEDALLWRLRLINSAQEELVLSTFDFRADKCGGDVLSALYDAAERGVNVRILVDGMNGQLHFKHTPEVRALAAHENAEIKLYNPINILKPWQVQPHLHDKYIVADGSTYILGGRNVNDLFLGEMSAKSSSDLELLVCKEADERGTAEELCAYFEDIWGLPCCKSVRGKADSELLKERYAALRLDMPAAFEPVDFCEGSFKAESVRLIKGSPEPVNKPPIVWKQLCAAMERGQDIVIQTPYVICSGEMYRDLAALAAGRSVEIVTNSVETGANPWGCAELMGNMDDILQTGVNMRTLCAGHSVHTKAVLIDEDISIIGSYNLDMRSTYLDTEMMLMVDCAELNAQLRADYAKEASCLYAADGEISTTGDLSGSTLSPGRAAFYKLLHIVTTPVRFML